MTHRAIIIGNQNRRLFSHRPFAGGIGVSLYVASGPAASPAPAIRYRKRSLINAGRITVGFGRVSSGIKANQRDQSQTTEDDITLALDPDTAYRVNVRTFRDDLENDSVDGERTFSTDANTHLVSTVKGSGHLLRVEKRDGDSARVRCVWSDAGSEGEAATQLALVQQSGPTTIGEITVPIVQLKRQYLIDVPGLQDAGAYTFQIEARSANGSTLLDNNNGDDPATQTFTITGDSSGPGNVSGLSSEER